MNRKFNLALICFTGENGFALHVVIGMGLIMTLIGMTMIMRSQGDQVTALAQKGTAQSLSISEVGVTRVQSLLLKFPKLAQEEYDPEQGNWKTYATKNIGTACGTNAITAVTDVTGGWISVKDNDENTVGHF
jgi:hypothetical protein